MIYGGLFDLDSKLIRRDELNNIINSVDFWNSDNRENVLKENNFLNEIINSVNNVKKKIDNNIEFLNMDIDNELLDLIRGEYFDLKDEVEKLRINTYLSGEFDQNDCILEIHSGAGGTESCDWANMLYRMYTRYCEKNNFKIELIDFQDGDEAGLKSVSFIVHGLNAYGLLKNEKGVHRLIRISPFDSNKRRHTSFVSIDITPIFTDDLVDIDIPDSDIRIDVYRSSGKGGQGVNTTDSAVRITHIPSKIVVTCQNERSQIRNKETAMKVLKNKLYKLEVEKKESELKKIKGENTEINFGSQIRTYTMHPYSLVKDHRTNTENANVLKVLDGDLDIFINDNLKLGVK